MTEQVYSALSGDEVRQAVLQEIEKYLKDDYRFKKAIAYHRLSWKWNLNFKAFQQPEQDLTVQGEVTAKKLEDKVAQLEQQLASKDSEWKRALEAAVQERHQETATLQLEIRSWQDKYNELAALLENQASPAPAALAQEADPVPSEDGSVEFSVSAVKPEIEQPDKVRESIADGLEGVVVGKTPQEAHIPDTDGKPAPASTARGAVVGGGKRPTNVVGRPR